MGRGPSRTVKGGISEERWNEAREEARTDMEEEHSRLRK